MKWSKPAWDSSEFNYVFCINAGRSGSNYLAELLDSASNATAYHEPEPKMIKQHLTSVTKSQYSASYKKRKVKIRGIQGLCHNLPKGHSYIETNHMFIKTFYDVVMNELPNVRVIRLQRELSLVLKSFVELNYFTQNNKFWPYWMISPAAVTGAVECPMPYEKMDQIDRTIAYLIDIQGRAERFKNEYPEALILDIKLEALNEPAEVKGLFDWLDLRATEGSLNFAEKRINSRQRIKKKHNNPVCLEYCKERVGQYLSRLEQRQITYPKSLYFEL